MRIHLFPGHLCATSALLLSLATGPALADGNLQNLQHIIIVMQENHSFDNYFGVLGYVPGGPYHPALDFDHDRGEEHGEGCRPDDHRCVDGLTCKVTPTGSFQCRNSNLDDDGSTVFAFHDA